MRIPAGGEGVYISTKLTEMLMEKAHEVTANDRFLFGETSDHVERVTKIQGNYLLNSYGISFNNIIKGSGR